MTIHGIEEFLALAGSRRVVFLGECSHDMDEFYAAKTEIVRRLVDEHDFSLIILEAGMAACAGAMLDDAPHAVDRLQEIYNFYSTPHMLALVEWASARQENARPAIVGMDPRVLTRGGDWIAATLGRLGYPGSDAFAENELSLYQIWRNQQLTGAAEGNAEGIDRTRLTLIDALKWLVELDDDSLEARLVERILVDRLSLLDVISDENAYFDWRERRMASNIEWWCGEVYPDRKVIVWGHNYHLMRRRSAVDAGVNAVECVSTALMRSSFVLGLYSNGGIGTYPDGKPFPIPAAAPGSIEQNGIADGEKARITIFPDAEGWWRTPCSSLSFGLEEETLVPAEQYDGVLVVRDVSPRAVVDPELVRRLPA
jgi:erythromycin esterase